jgi:threonine 3-dehydrogenase
VAGHAGARHVVITDFSEYRLDVASKMRVSLALDASRDPVAEAMAQLHMVEGFDVGFEMSGAPAAMASMLSVMCHGGKIAMLGLPTEDFAIDWSNLVTNMITVKGIYGRQMFETWYWMSVFVESGLDISPVITHRFPVERFEEAFAVLESGLCGKVVLSWDDGGP